MKSRRGGALLAIVSLTLGGVVVASTTTSALADPPTPPTGLALGFGLNNTGQLGLGTAVVAIATPTAAALPSGVTAVQVAPGYTHSLALGSDGKVYAWGTNHYGELGNGTQTGTDVGAPSPAVVTFAGNPTITSVAAGYYDSFAVTSGGAVYSWGLGNAGQLASGALTNRNAPALVSMPGGATVQRLSAGYAHVLAITTTGALYAWGYNAGAQIGDNTVTTRTTAVPVNVPGGVISASAGYLYSLAVSTNGTVYGWGTNTKGQIGDGTTTPRGVPTAVTLPGASAPAVAVSAGQQHSLAVTGSGAVYTWGDNTSGQLGHGTTGGQSVSPQVLALPSGVIAASVSASFASSLVRSTTGTVYGFGDNTYGELGNGNGTASNVPVATKLPAGSHAIGLGTSAYSYSAFAIVPPTASVTTVSTSGSPAAANHAITFTATVSPTDGGGSVAFFADGSATPIAGCAAAPLNLSAGSYQATCSVSSLADGSHTISATYTGDALYLTSSGDLAGGQSVVATHGAVVGWGANTAGQLGAGATAFVAPNGLALPSGVSIAASATGYLHSVLLTSTGTVYSVGDNTYGELGDGTTTASASVVPVTFPDSVTIVAVSAGYYDSFALTSTGHVYAWGLNGVGELGLGSTANSSTPKLLTFATGTVVTAISAGYAHALALTASGAVYSWGYNATGQLGDGTGTTRTSPVAVHLPAGTSVTAIAAGVAHSVAATASGSVLAWGDNTNGELGNGTTTLSVLPVATTLPSGVRASGVSAGLNMSVLLTSTGAVYDWGVNTYGELGNGTTTSSSLPVAVTLPGGATATAVVGTYADTYALTSDGKVFGWGDNSFGELGNGTVTASKTPTAVALPTGSHATAIGAGPYTFAMQAVVSTVTTSATITTSANPVPANSAVTFVATVSPSSGTGTVSFFADGSATAIAGCANTALVASGSSFRAACSVSTLSVGHHSVVATYSGDPVYLPSSATIDQVITAAPSGVELGFGYNAVGQLGNGTTANSAVPVAAQLPAGVSASAVATGFGNSLILTTTGAVYASGDNTSGELGNGTTTSSTTPVLVSLPSGVTVIAVGAGYDNGFALTSTGAVYAWGLNTYGELGIGTTTNALTPTLVDLPAGTVATAISAGFGHTLALTSTGRAYAWGLNTSGQLGNGTGTTTATPVAVHLPAGVVATAIAAGYAHSLAVSSSGTVYSWGDNTYGELGVGTSGTATPTAVDLGGGTATAVSGGYFTSQALINDGSLRAWGLNNVGQLGNNSTTNAASPVTVSLPDGVHATAGIAEYSNGLALTDDGKIYAWGDNSFGQLGRTDVAASHVPVLVQLPTGASAQAFGASNFSVTNLAIVGAVSTSTTLTSSANPSLVHQTVTFTATVTPTDGGGTVAFFADGSATPITGCATKALVVAAGNHVATCATSALAVGAHSISAVYTGDAVYLTSTGTLSGGEVVNAVPTTTTITASNATPTIGQTVTFTASVAPTDGGGTVAFYADGVVISGCGTEMLALTGLTYQATCSTSSLTSGPHTIVAKYSGDTDYLPSQATLAGGVTVSIATTLVAADTKIIGSLLHLKVSYSATLTAQPNGTPVIGKAISFVSGGGGQSCSAITDSNGVATCTVNVSVTFSKYTATFAGSGLYLPSSDTAAVKLI
jgi:alpha-tubulin suppressor-like RCC1 family protein